MSKGLGRRGVHMLLIATALLAGAAGIALATIPGTGGTISGCYEKRTGILRVIDVQAGKSCLGFETPISWSQQGPQGERGLQGERGARGEQGLSGERGADGAPGVQGDPGPQGLQGERGPQGIQGERGPQGLTGSAGPPGGLSGYEVVVRSSDNLDDKGGHEASVNGFAGCPSGKVVTGGGYRRTDTVTIFDDVTVSHNGPSFSSLGWSVRVVNIPTTELLRIEVYAICAAL